jgi:hypothetical protein
LLYVVLLLAACVPTAIAARAVSGGVSPHADVR